MKNILSFVLFSIFFVAPVYASHMTLGQKPPVIVQDRVSSLEQQLGTVTQELQACKTIVRSLVSVCKNMDEKLTQVQGQHTQLNEDYLRLLRTVNGLAVRGTMVEQSVQVDVDTPVLHEKKSFHVDPTGE